MKSSLLYYSLDISRSKVIVVSDDLFGLKKAFSVQPILLGIDTESKPTRRKGEFNVTALIQVAVRYATGDEVVYILDLLELAKIPGRMNDLNNILSSPLGNPEVIKFGQGLGQDFIQLKKSYSEMSCFQDVQGILDTNKIHRWMNKEADRDFSLKHFSQTYLHFDLDKSCQMSNWARRPLHHRQIEYAACDALILLRLFDAMTFEANDLAGFNLKAHVQSLCEIEAAIAASVIERKKRKNARKSMNNSNINDKEETTNNNSAVDCPRHNFPSAAARKYYLETIEFNENIELKRGVHSVFPESNDTTDMNHLDYVDDVDDVDGGDDVEGSPKTNFITNTTTTNSSYSLSYENKENNSSSTLSSLTTFEDNFSTTSDSISTSSTCDGVDPISMLATGAIRRTSSSSSSSSSIASNSVKKRRRSEQQWSPLCGKRTFQQF